MALATAIVWGVDAELIHTRPFMPTVHSKGKYFPRHFKRTNSLLRSLQKKRRESLINMVVHFSLDQAVWLGPGPEDVVPCSWARRCTLLSQYLSPPRSQSFESCIALSTR